MEGVSGRHSVKRQAEDELERDQRLAKRFNFLNIGTLSRSLVPTCCVDTEAEHDGNLYIPVGQPPADDRNRKPRESNDDAMQLDSTKDKVYIYNIDDELSDTESEGERLVFLPDFERRLTKIPKSILTGHSSSTGSNEMVLYSVPTSLSIPQEHDNVRKAIIETRARAREKQAQDKKSLQSNRSTASPVVSSLGNGYQGSQWQSQTSGSIASGFGNGISKGLPGASFSSRSSIDEDGDAMDIG
ncbi:MAG: hypothetical protein M1827_004365 [Pycnora praestabilis]|nr:MAG: hypothetical protein M1827_004365 [Pycnora praestabilis]